MNPDQAAELARIYQEETRARAEMERAAREPEGSSCDGEAGPSIPG